MTDKNKLSKKHKPRKMLLELPAISRINTRKRIVQRPGRTEHLLLSKLLTRLPKK
jgi:hypothetical protein